MGVTGKGKAMRALYLQRIKTDGMVYCGTETGDFICSHDEYS
jgi:hypothetical protein